MLLALLTMLCQAPADPPRPVRTPRGALVAHIVDEDGALLVDGWVIEFTHEERPREGHFTYSRTAHSVLVDPGSGTATQSDVVPGEYILSARHHTGERIEAVQVKVPAGPPTECELRLAGPAPERGLYVRLQLGYPMALDDPVRIVARSAEGAAIELEALSRDCYGARGVPPGMYTASVEDARFEPATIADFARGTSQSLTLWGSAALVLTLRDELDGSAVVPSAILVEAALERNRSRRLVATVPEALEHRITGLLPTAFVVTLAFDDRPSVSVEIEELQPARERRVIVDVPRGATVRGVVVDEHGLGIEGVPVEIRTRNVSAFTSTANRPTTKLTATGHMIFKRGGITSRDFDLPTRRNAVTAADGSFELHGLAPGDYTLRVHLTPWWAEFHDMPIAAGTHRPIDLRIPVQRKASLDLQFKFPVGTTLADYDLAFQYGAGVWQRIEGGRGLRPGEPDRITLRGVKAAPCTLVVTLAAGAQRSTSHNVARRFEFTPTLGAPAVVPIDLTQDPRRP